MSPTEKITYVTKLLYDSMKEQPSIQYIAHLSWLILLKYLNDYETIAEPQAEQRGEPYIPIIEKGCRWSDWVPYVLNLSPSVVEDNALYNNQLTDFLRRVLFPHLCAFWTWHYQLPIQRTLASIFRNPTIPICDSVNVLREVLEIVDSIDFHRPDILSAIAPVYEGLLQQMKIDDTLARDFITPSSLMHSIVEILNPQQGEIVYDPACGTGGFLIEAYKHMRGQLGLDIQERQPDVIYGNALDKISTLLCATRVSLAEVTVTQIHIGGDRLQGDPTHFDKRSRLIILTNPPFGVLSEEEIKQSNLLETGYNIPLFLNHCMDMMAESAGIASVIVSSKALEMDLPAFVDTRARLLKEFNLLMAVGLPPGTFTNTKVGALMLIFEAGTSTKETFYCDIDLPNHGSIPTQPLEEVPFTSIQKAWEMWQKYRLEGGHRPLRTTTTWIEIFDDKKFKANNYILGMERPFKYEMLPLPLELAELLLANRPQLHQAANIQKPLLEPTHRVLQLNQQLQQQMRNVRENLARTRKKDDRDN